MLPSRYGMVIAIMNTVAMDTFTRLLPQHPVIDRGGVCESPPLPKELLAVNSCCRGVLLFFKGVATGELAEKKKWYRGN